MSIFDKLLETDAAKLSEKEKTKVEITRLSGVFGEPFVLTCSAMTEDQFAHVAEISKKGETKINIILETCRLEGRKLSDPALMEKLHVHTGKDAVKKLFRAGEINSIYETVSRLSGYGVDAVREVKN